MGVILRSSPFRLTSSLTLLDRKSPISSVGWFHQPIRTYPHSVGKPPVFLLKVAALRGPVSAETGCGCAYSSAELFTRVRGCETRLLPIRAICQWWFPQRISHIRARTLMIIKRVRIRAWGWDGEIGPNQGFPGKPLSDAQIGPKRAPISYARHLRQMARHAHEVRRLNVRNVQSGCVQSNPEITPFRGYPAISLSDGWPICTGAIHAICLQIAPYLILPFWPYQNGGHCVKAMEKVL